MESFEKQKNRKAFTYTTIICTAIALLCILVSWKTKPVTVPLAQDLIEVNLGNMEEGLGTEQPNIKGERSPYRENIPEASASNTASSQEKVTPEDNADNDAAAVMPVTKTNPKAKMESPDEGKNNKPQTPRITYNGPNRQNGNNADQDNGYRYQGNNPNGQGDAGSPDGNRDSYGNNPGGRQGGNAMVTKGGRRIVSNTYTFSDDFKQPATIYAKIRVTPDGKGSWIDFDKGSTSRDEVYKRIIIKQLANITFDKGNATSEVTVKFPFRLN